MMLRQETLKGWDGTLSKAISMVCNVSGNAVTLTCNKSSKSHAASLFMSETLLENVRID